MNHIKTAAKHEKHYRFEVCNKIIVILISNNNVTTSPCGSLCRTPSCPSLYATISSTFSGRLSGSLKTSTSRTSSVSHELNRTARLCFKFTHLPVLMDFWGLLIDSLCRCVSVRREIDSLNERLAGDGQAIEGGDPSKGALKAKGTWTFSHGPWRWNLLPSL